MDIDTQIKQLDQEILALQNQKKKLLEMKKKWDPERIGRRIVRRAFEKSFEITGEGDPNLRAQW